MKVEPLGATTLQRQIQIGIGSGRSISKLELDEPAIGVEERQRLDVMSERFLWLVSMGLLHQHGHIRSSVAIEVTGDDVGSRPEQAANILTDFGIQAGDSPTGM